MRHICWLAIFIAVVLLGSCTGGPDRKVIAQKKESLRTMAAKINSDFATVRKEAEKLANSIENIYSRKEEFLKQADTSNYTLAPSGVLHKTYDDGNSAVFVSGFVPVTDFIKNIVYFTASMDSELKRITRDFPAVSQAYYNDKHSYNRIYPFFDVLSQYYTGMNIPSFNFYYLADRKHNPEKNSLWVDEPYVDPAGRGWMVSAIAPVYENDALQGVAGLDVTVATITDQYIHGSDKLLITDSASTLVAAKEKTVLLLDMPQLVDHTYASTITSDTYRKEDYSLLMSQTNSIRAAARTIYEEKKDEASFTWAGKQYTFVAARVPEMRWVLIELIPWQ